MPVEGDRQNNKISTKVGKRKKYSHVLWITNLELHKNCERYSQLKLGFLWE